MVRLLKKVCPRCNKAYNTYTEDMVYCNATCKSRHEYEKKFNVKRELKKSNCKNCNIEIGGGREYCCHECKKLYHKTKLSTEKNLEYFTKPKSEFKPRKRISYDELNRRAEYKRLYEDFYIDRQLSGKARDLI